MHGLSANRPSNNWALNIYFCLTRFHSSFQLIHFRYGSSTCSHYPKVWHRTYPICDAPLSKIGAAQLHSVTITVVICEQKPYPVWFVCRRN